MRTATPIVLTATERKTLVRWARASSPARLRRRARIVLLAADGLQNDAVASRLQTDAHTVARWRSRFSAERLAGLGKDAPRSGRSRRKRDRLVSEVLRLTKRRRRKPWTSRTLAKKLNVSHMLVYRIWKDHGLGQETT